MSDKTKTRYAIAEWYGQSFTSLKAPRRRIYAEHALRQADDKLPPCPFQANQPPCSKKGGVCSIQRYTEKADKNGLRLVRDHWEVLTLEASNKRLQAAETVSREHFEASLKSRLRPL